MVKRGVSLVFFLILILFISNCCEKDDPDLTINNPYNGKTTAIFNPEKEYGSVTDIDGNIYKTIQIGDQIWMAENLRTTRYRNGDEIPNIYSIEEWSNLSIGAYCSYDNTTSSDTIATYGLLYNWHAVNDSRRVAPRGWRVANMNDWHILSQHLGGDSILASKLKESGDLHWFSPSSDNNPSGFTALPNGFRYYTGKPRFIGIYASYWSADEYDQNGAYFLSLFTVYSKIYVGANFKKNGYAIRCVKE